jgi:peptidyl-prolyl cis-trans isomerase D
MLAWSMERRTATLVELPFADAPEPEAPTEAQLARYHENNARLFSTPEYRDVALATLNAALLMAEVEVSERDIEDAYAANRARYETPEKREVFQALMQDEAAAQAIATAWQANADFAAIEAAARAAGGLATPLGLSTRAELPVPALAEAAFALAPGAVSAPVRTPFGWHVLRVGQIEAGAQRRLDEVRGELRAEIQAERAADLAFDRVNRVEDALAGGASLAEAARRYSLGYVEARLDATGRAPDGTQVALPIAPTVRPAVLRAIFTAERGAAPRLQEGEWGFLALDVREVTPPACAPWTRCASRWWPASSPPPAAAGRRSARPRCWPRRGWASLSPPRPRPRRSPPRSSDPSAARRAAATPCRVTCWPRSSSWRRTPPP